jgi:arylsulfatase A-like enzyme
MIPPQEDISMQNRLHSMKARCLQLVLLLAPLNLAQAEDSSTTKPGDARPNFVLCMADDLGWGDTGFNGHPKLQTPVLDEMARTGLRLDRFYSASSVCSPTRGSLLTGRNPNRFGCFSWGHQLRPQEVTVAEVLRAAGYATGHFGKWHLGEVLQGAPNSPGESGFDQWLSAPNFFDNNPLLSNLGKVVQTKGESSHVPTEAALKFIRSAKQSGKPFLVVLWFGNPHNPHQGWPELKSIYSDLPEAEQNYYAEVTGVDRAMGELRQGLRELDLAENTLVWFNSDNGPQAGKNEPGSSGGLRGRKASLWEGGIRVPGIIEWPARIKQPAVSEMPGSTMDIYPTVLELAGMKPKHQPELDGESLVGVIDGKQTKRVRPIGFWDYPIKGIGTPSNKILADWKAKQETGMTVEPSPLKPFEPLPTDQLPGHAVWMDGNWKLHKTLDKNGNDHFHLYNLGTDRAEAKDLAMAEPERVKQMQAALQLWQLSVIRSHNGEDYQTD